MEISTLISMPTTAPGNNIRFLHLQEILLYRMFTLVLLPPSDLSQVSITVNKFTYLLLACCPISVCLFWELLLLLLNYDSNRHFWICQHTLQNKKQCDWVLIVKVALENLKLKLKLAQRSTNPLVSYRHCRGLENGKFNSNIISLE